MKAEYKPFIFKQRNRDKKPLTLEQNCRYQARKYYRSSKRHFVKKALSKNIGEAAMHGVSATQFKNFGRILKTIADRIRAEYTPNE